MSEQNKLDIKEEQLLDALSKRYLDYAISTIVDRALPDVRDGLKPVHRRLLYAMRVLRLNPKTAFKKCARVVGDVIGKYHPHGDVAVYEAMVRLAQNFSVRYPLVDGQGNFGNIDGDSAAAMRYTEARLTEAGEVLMRDLDKDTVDFIDNYDGSEEEPVVMPAAFPNLLANGAMGIAVGMATNIPPHNVDELCTALTHLIKNPDMTVAKLVDYVKGPDFPTGGTVIDKKAHIVNIYEKGMGAFTIRAKWEKEELSYGNYQIVITEIPYGVVKSKLIEKIADLMEQKKLPFINDIRDESAEDVRIVIEPKNRTIEVDILMAHLFKTTDLESKFNMNMNVLDAQSVPRVMNLKEVLVEFLAHRRIVLTRKSNFRLKNIENRLEVLDGFLKAYLNLDRVIAIIRENDEPKPLLIKEFELTDTQADAILDMKLRSLRKLEEMELKNEHAKLSKERKELLELLGSDLKIDEALIAEFDEIKEIMGKKTKFGKRRTQLQEADTDIVIDENAFIEKEPITVLLSKRNWIRAVKGHQDLNEKFPAKEGDENKFAFHVMTNEKILIAANNGKFYTIGADKISRGKGFGEPISLLIDIEDGVEILDAFKYEEGQKLLLVNDNGVGFVTNTDNVLAVTKTGRIVFNLNISEKLEKIFKITDGDDKVAIISDDRKLLIFNLEEIPELSKGKGVILQKYRENKMSDVITFNSKEGLYWITGRGKTVVDNYVLWESKRANQGYFAMPNFPKSNKFI